jgi:hypothetical protein
MWENGEFTGRGLTDLMERARRHDDAAREGRDNGDRFSQDEFTVLNGGFRSHQEIEDFDCRRQGANLSTDGVGSSLPVAPYMTKFVKHSPNQSIRIKKRQLAVTESQLSTTSPCQAQTSARASHPFGLTLTSSMAHSGGRPIAGEGKVVPTKI